MAATEQYFSSESLTASSTDFLATLPFTRYSNLMAVNTRGDSVAFSASAWTSTAVKGSRFFCRMVTTSAAVHPHKPINTNSIGLLADLLLPSMAREWLAWPSSLVSEIHLTLAWVIFYSPLVLFTSSHLRLSVLGSGWMRTRNNSGAACLKRISSAVERSCTRASGKSSGKVQWQETYT